MKYTYICYMKSKGEHYSEEESSRWRKEHDATCKEHNVKPHTFGVAYGVMEEYVGVYETDRALDEWQKFRNSLVAIKPQWISYTRTNQVLNV